ncbi:Sensor histidine kinase YycG [Planctomycetes bacterium Poly30]|uniref:histidine kinase n=2 Tax=Saltatorellus ferox TaxID=2528018 RepID=A0A518EZR9_9BACT|nr:Sensor histidine kinase YycG [Planctomycetes bacterium Poly30]
MSYAIVILATVGATGFLVLREYRQDLSERMETSLRNQLVCLADLVDGTRPGLEPATVMRRAHEVAAATGRRITVIAADGSVIADSDADADGMENHGARPEVREAIRSGFGVDRRRSATIGRELLYVAHAPGATEAPRDVVRIAVALESIDKDQAAVARLILAGAGLASILALVVGAFIVRRVSYPLDRMRRVVNALGAGDYAARVSLPKTGARRDELGEMASALNRLGFDLSQRVSELTAGQERLRAMVAGMIEGVVAVDEDDRITFSNYAARRMLHLDSTAPGFEPSKRSKLRLWEQVKIAGLDALLATARRSDSAAQCELELSSTDEDAVVRAQAHRFQDGDSVGVVVVLEDVSEIRRLERIRRDFVANVSHELKTPLTSIRGYVETLLDGAIDDDDYNVRFLEKIESNVLRLNHLVTDLLSLARIEAEAGFLNLRPVDLHAVVEEAIRRHEQTAKLRGQTLRADSCSGSVRVFADQEALTQVIDNLIDNGLKYTPDDREIVVRVQRNGKLAILEVEDSGVGIPVEDQARIFERFYRVDKARSRAVGGTGLGLSIVKHLAQAMDGSVELKSQPGKGSIFRVKLKLVE